MESKIVFSQKRLKIYDAALSAVKKIQQNGFKAYFVGGALRDMLLGRTPKDIDIATSAVPDKIEKIFPRCHHVGASFGILTVVVDNIPLEVAGFREEKLYCDGRHPEEISYTDSPEIDAKRRDFTINGLYYDPVSDNLIDFHNGIKDIKNGLIRTIGSPDRRFKEDYLRILRAVRFSVRFAFPIEKSCMQAMKKYAGKLLRLSAERIRDELNMILSGPDSDTALLLMDKLGILKHILPEISDMKGVKQSEKYHPEGDVFQHTILMLKHMPRGDLKLAWAVLLHDVGKPEVYRRSREKSSAFYAHEAIGAKMTEKIMKRFKMSVRFRNDIVSAVAGHMTFMNTPRMKKSTWRKMIGGDNFKLELELQRIDCISSHGKMENYLFFLDKIAEMNDEPVLPESLLSGRDLIEMGIPQSPQIGKILRKIRNMQLDNEIKNRAEALKFARSLFE